MRVRTGHSARGSARTAKSALSPSCGGRFGRVAHERPSGAASEWSSTRAAAPELEGHASDHAIAGIVRLFAEDNVPDVISKQLEYASDGPVVLAISQRGPKFDGHLDSANGALAGDPRQFPGNGARLDGVLEGVTRIDEIETVGIELEVVHIHLAYAGIVAEEVDTHRRATRR